MYTPIELHNVIPAVPGIIVPILDANDHRKEIGAELAYRCPSCDAFHFIDKHGLVCTPCDPGTQVRVRWQRLDEHIGRSERPTFSDLRNRAAAIAHPPGFDEPIVDPDSDYGRWRAAHPCGADEDAAAERWANESNRAYLDEFAAARRRRPSVAQMEFSLWTIEQSEKASTSRRRRPATITFSEENVVHV